MNTPATIDELVATWDLDPSVEAFAKTADHKPASFSALRELLEFEDRIAFHSYVPTKSSDQSAAFADRLFQWLGNTGLTEADRRLLFEFATRLSFFSFDDFLSLYRSAFVGPIARWVMKQAGVRLDQPDWESTFSKQWLNGTWYCPVTDSMVISEFYHINQIAGISHRPGFRSLRKFQGNGDALRAYMQENGLVRLVLLEDFVGSGTQSAAAVRWAVDELKCPVLFVPLVTGPDGVNRLREVQKEVPAGKLEIVPVITLEHYEFVEPATQDRDPLFWQMKELANRVHPHVRGLAVDDSKVPPYSPTGFSRPGDQHKGATVVLFSNCPDNTVPLVHHHSRVTAWKPLFPRVERESS